FSTLTIPAGTLVAGRSYYATISFGIAHVANKTAVPGAVGVVFSNNFLEFPLSVVASANAAPTIATQPAAKTIATGSTVIFSVAADGTPAPTYQWRRSTTAIAGETRSTLVLSGAAASAGSYNCIVSNAGGT